MTTLSGIISRSLRMLGVKGSGETATADEANDGLDAVQAVLYNMLVARAVLTGVEIEDEYTAVENVRIFNRAATLENISMPETVTDAVTGQPRAPANGAIVEIAGSTHQAYIFVSHFGAWKQLQGLTLLTANPLGPAHDNDLAALTAVYLAPEFGVQPSAVLVGMAQAAKTSLRQRFRQPIAAVTDPLINAPWLRTNV